MMDIPQQRVVRAFVLVSANDYEINLVKGHIMFVGRHIVIHNYGAISCVGSIKEVPANAVMITSEQLNRYMSLRSMIGHQDAYLTLCEIIDEANNTV